MGCRLDQQLIDNTIEFHGHTCPGLAIGIRLSELAMERLDIHNSSAPLCVTETDMCAVDAIQYLTGCSLGKGNLVHKDYGKSGFTFFNRDSGKGFRAVYNRAFKKKESEIPTLGELMSKMSTGRATDKEKQLLETRRISAIEAIMTAEPDELFSIKTVNEPPVRPPRILESLKCESCREMTMESRTRRFGGKTLCIPCFMKKEQKI